MAVVIDFRLEVRRQAQRDVDAVVLSLRPVVPIYQTPRPPRPPVQYEAMTCDFDGRGYLGALGSEDSGYCRPACAEAAVRPRGGHRADA